MIRDEEALLGKKIQNQGNNFDPDKDEAIEQCNIETKIQRCS